MSDETVLPLKTPCPDEQNPLFGKYVFNFNQRFAITASYLVHMMDDSLMSSD